jgi:hypothetical protein
VVFAKHGHALNQTLPYIVCGLEFTIGAGASMQLMPDLNAWKENHVL